MKRTHSLSAFGGGTPQDSGLLRRGDQGLPASGGAKGASGFTMIEVLIVIVIMGILAGVAIPGFARWLPNYRLKGAARDLYSNLQLAKTGAVKERGQWAVVFNAGTNSYKIWSGGANRVYDAGGDDVEHKNVSLPGYGSGVTFGTGSASPPAVTGEVAASTNPVVFNSSGFTTGTDPVVAYLANNRNACYAVGTLASGAVVIKKWNGSAWE